MKGFQIQNYNTKGKKVAKNYAFLTNYLYIFIISKVYD